LYTYGDDDMNDSFMGEVGLNNGSFIKIAKVSCVLSRNNNNNNNNNVECKNKGDTSSNRANWDYFKVIQKIRE